MRDKLKRRDKKNNKKTQIAPAKAFKIWRGKRDQELPEIEYEEDNEAKKISIKYPGAEIITTARIGETLLEKMLELNEREDLDATMIIEASNLVEAE